MPLPLLVYALRARCRGYEVTVMKGDDERRGPSAGPVRAPLPPLGAKDEDEVRPW